MSFHVFPFMFHVLLYICVYFMCVLYIYLFIYCCLVYFDIFVYVFIHFMILFVGTARSTKNCRSECSKVASEWLWVACEWLDTPAYVLADVVPFLQPRMVAHLAQKRQLSI